MAEKVGEGSPELTSGLEPAASSAPRKGQWLLLGLVICGLGSIAQGVGISVFRHQGRNTEPAALFNLIAVVAAMIVMRRLRWWLVPLFPVAVIAVSLGSIPFDPMASAVFGYGDSVKCPQDYKAFVKGLALITKNTSDFWVDYQVDSASTGYISPSQWAGWSEDWRVIGQQYEQLPDFGGAGDYIRLSVDAADYYELGFHQFAMGNSADGYEYLALGDGKAKNASDEFSKLRVPNCDYDPGE